MTTTHLPVLLCDIIGITLIICALAATDTRFKTSDRIRRLLILMGVLTFVSLLCDMGVRLAEGYAGATSRIAIFVFKSVLFLTEADIGFTWLSFVDFYLYRDKRFQRKWLPVLAIPLYLTFALLVVNVFTPIVFTVSADNVYQRGGAGFFLLNLVPVFYLLLSLVDTWHYRRQHGFFRFFNIASFLVPVVIGFAFHLLGLDFDIAWTMVAVGLVSVVLSLQSRMVYIDTLTGLYTRAYFDRIFARSASVIRGGMMLDINYFKSINDRYGHAEGDRALAAIGEILNAAVVGVGIAVRMAGDEFIVLFNSDEAGVAETLTERVHRDAKAASARLDLPYTLTLSVGSAPFDAASETQAAFVKALDRAMYADKAAFYEKHPELERRQ